MVEYETGQTETGRKPSYNPTASNKPGDGPKKRQNKPEYYIYILINQLCKHL